jgi:hypothetical protein
MKKEELLKLELGSYNLTDSIDTYKYSLDVFLSEYDQRLYYIRNQNEPYYSYIVLFEELIDDEIKLTSMAKIGDICIHSEDVNSIIDNLKIIK